MMSMVSMETPIRDRQITIMYSIKVPDTPSYQQAMTRSRGGAIGNGVIARNE